MAIFDTENELSEETFGMSTKLGELPKDLIHALTQIS